jgi:hypothetical protein
MPQCRVCTSPHRADVERWILGAVPYRTITTRLAERGETLYPRSLSAHRKHTEELRTLVNIKAAERLVREAVTELEDRQEAWRYLEALNLLHSLR